MKYFNDEVSRVTGTNRALKELSSTREILEQLQVNERRNVLTKISSTGGIHAESTVVFYEVAILTVVVLKSSVHNNSVTGSEPTHGSIRLPPRRN